MNFENKANNSKANKTVRTVRVKTIDLYRTMSRRLNLIVLMSERFQISALRILAAGFIVEESKAKILP
jgi:hypothetical protein